MAPARNRYLAQKIANLQLRLAPLVPLPTGSPHEAFPRTLLAYNLLTEDELDSIAHHYHQSTPGLWTYEYPACMNWDKDFLNASKRRTSVGRARRHSQSLEAGDWWNEFLSSPAATEEGEILSPRNVEKPSQARRWSVGLTNKERVAIKRRKVGKFIGLVGMDTPVEEIEGRIQMSLERATRLAREESRRLEEMELGRKKMA